MGTCQCHYVAVNALQLQSVDTAMPLPSLSTPDTFTATILKGEVMGIAFLLG